MGSFVRRFVTSSSKNRPNASAGFREKSALVGLYTLFCLSFAGKSFCLSQFLDFDF